MYAKIPKDRVDRDKLLYFVARLLSPGLSLPMKAKNLGFCDNNG